MHYKIIVFDFDGTLINSNEIKLIAYYKAFSSVELDKSIIDDILKEFPELNRYDTIGKIILASNNSSINQDEIIFRYNKIVMTDIIKATPLEYAEKILVELKKRELKLYLSSNTPLEILSEIINAKNWRFYFKDIYGYPSEKSETIKKIIKENKFSKDKYLVVGDGESDKISASSNNIDFFKVKEKSLKDLAVFLRIEV